MRTNSIGTLAWIMLLLLPASSAWAQLERFDPKKIKLLDPPDLQVTGMRLLKADDTGDWLITIQVIIKNNNFIKAQPSRIKIMVQSLDQPGLGWKLLTQRDFPEVLPRNSVIQEIEIYDKTGVMRKVKQFNLKVIADPDNRVQEANERNNESAVIRVSKRI